MSSDSWKTVPGFCPKTAFKVKGLIEGKPYVFRVRAENIYGLSEPLDGKPVVAKSPFDPPDAPSTPEITGYGPSTLQLEVESSSIYRRKEQFIYFITQQHFTLLSFLMTYFN